MEDKKNLYTEEVTKLQPEDIDSVAGGSQEIGGAYRGRYFKLKAKLQKAQIDFNNNRISIEEYTAAIREITEFREMLMRKYQIDEATLDQMLKKRQ